MEARVNVNSGKKRERVSVYHQVQENSIKSVKETENISAPLYKNTLRSRPSQVTSYTCASGRVTEECKGQVWHAVKRRRTPSCPKGLNVDSITMMAAWRIS
jgi:hypothetical protein